LTSLMTMFYYCLCGRQLIRDDDIQVKGHAIILQ
jgi:hypothetical protein